MSFVQTDESGLAPYGCPNPRLRMLFRDDLQAYCRVLLYTAVAALTSEVVADAFAEEERGALDEAGRMMATRVIGEGMEEWDSHVELSLTVMAAILRMFLTEDL